MDQLHAQGAVKNRIFSMYLKADSSKGSKIVLGGYNLDKYADQEDSLFWHKSIDEHFWSVAMSEVRFGDQVMELQTSDAILDSGSSFIVIPEQDFNTFTSMVEKDTGRSCGIDRFNNNFFYCSCLTASYSDFPDLTISLGGAKVDGQGESDEWRVRNYTIPSRSYIEHKNLKCYFKIQKLPESGLFGAQHRMWVLGLSFMENYYSIFDYD